MKISKIVYLSILLISISIIFAFCLKILFFSSNNKSILETNKKYFDEIYSEYKKMNQSKKDLLTEKQFLNIFHCFFVISQLEIIDYGEMVIYILENNPILIENFMLKSKHNYIDGFNWLLDLDEDLFYKKDDQSVFTKKFEDSKSKIRTGFNDLEKSECLEILNDYRNDIKAFFESTSLNTQHLHNILFLFDICITNEDVLINCNSILMKPALLYAIDFLELNWLKNLSTDMTKNILSSEFTTPEGTFPYLYISLYSWIYASKD